MRIKSIPALLAIFFAATAFTITGCPADDPAPVDTHTDPHWSYSGDTGPSHWGSLSTDWADCAHGSSQSPINIDTSKTINSDLTDLVFNYKASTLELVNNGHTIQANVAAGNTMTVDGKTFDLLQFHFHSLSEHTVNGITCPIEVHFVHKASDGTLAVVGVCIIEGMENAAYKPVFDNLPATENATHNLAAQVNPNDLLPTMRNTFRYSGSLTTPPCSEGVKWNVMNFTIEASTTQIDAFKALYNHNYRPVQPLGSRTVQYDTN